MHHTYIYQTLNKPTSRQIEKSNFSDSVPFSIVGSILGAENASHLSLPARLGVFTDLFQPVYLFGPEVIPLKQELEVWTSPAQCLSSLTCECVKQRTCQKEMLSLPQLPRSHFKVTFFFLVEGEFWFLDRHIKGTASWNDFSFPCLCFGLTFLNASNNHFHKQENKSRYFVAEASFLSFAAPLPILPSAQTCPPFRDSDGPHFSLAF